MRKITLMLSILGLNVTTAVFASEELRVIETKPAFAVQFALQEEFTVLSQTEHVTAILIEKSRIEKFASFVHEENGKCGGFFDVTDEALNPKQAPAISYTYPVLDQRREDIEQAINQMNGKNIEIFTKRYSSNFSTRRANTKEGENAAKWLADAWSKMAGSYERSDITVDLTTPPSGYAQPNVRITIPGTDRSLPLVILGGHLDSINHKDGKLAPGMDDDASGIGALTEVYRTILANHFRGKATIQIIGYAAEELGLYGSRALAEKYANEGAKVRAVLQLDMVGYPGPGHTVTFITDHVNAALTNWTEKLFSLYIGEPYKREKCDYACSDHASWDRYGYASVFPFEAPDAEMNDMIHTSGDIWDGRLDGEYAVKFSKLAYAFAAILSTE